MFRRGVPRPMIGVTGQRSCECNLERGIEACEGVQYCYYF